MKDDGNDIRLFTYIFANTKGRHSSCIDSCNHLSALNANKYGQCSGLDDLDSYSDALIDKDHWPVGKRLSSESSTIEFSSNTGDYCARDSDCADIQKCCDNRCQTPFINNKSIIRILVNDGPLRSLMFVLSSSNEDLPELPHNLTITERKKGKTVILQWESDYDKSKPAIFVVEGKWSLNYNNDDMTKWGYLAQVRVMSFNLSTKNFQHLTDSRFPILFNRQSITIG
jgi:hypothetical protein